MQSPKADSSLHFIFVVDCCLQLVVKSQILAGGRGLGTFKSGFKGGVHVTKRNEVEQVAGLCILSFQLFQFKM